MIIITGGAGFIGSAMLWELNRQGEERVLVVDELGLTTPPKWRNLSGLRYRDFIHKDDLPDLLSRNALANVSAIIHMGANSSTTETDADHLLTNNYTYSQTIARYCMERNVRLIYASSAATYGDGSNGYSDSTESIDALRPLNMYGYSKQLFDRWALHNGLFKTAAGLKFFNVYGPNEYHKGDMSSVVFKAFNQIGATGTVKLFKSHREGYQDGGQERDFIYVRDCTRIMAWLLDNPSAAGLFNAGTGIPRTFRDLAEATFHALNKRPDISYIPMPETLRDKYQYHTSAETKKLRDAGYSLPFTSLEDGVKAYVQQFLMKQNPYCDTLSSPKSKGR